MNRKISIILYIVICQLAIGQNNQVLTNFKQLPQEKIFVHYNSNFLLTGEKLYYKVYTLSEKNNLFSNISKVAYIALVDNKKNSILKQKINLKKGVGMGDFYIPSILDSGSYKLIAFTQWMKNKNIVFEEDIYIINPFKNVTFTERNPEENIRSKETTIKSALLDKKTYTKRDKINLKLNSTLENGEYSVSIKLRNSTIIPDKKNSIDFSKIIHQLNDNTTFFLPEVRGELIEGKIIPLKTSEMVSDIKVGLSFTQNNGEIKSYVGSTNYDGNFYFNLKDVSTDKILLQVLNENRENYKIELIAKENYPKNLNEFNTLSFSEELKETIRNRAIYFQIENIYNALKKDSLSIIPSVPITIFDDKKRTFVLNEYKKFNSIKEIFIEIVEKAFTSEDESGFKLHVQSLNKNLPPILIVDGYIVYNHNELFQVQAEDIKSISVAKERYLISNEEYNGAIIIDTHKRNFTPNSSSSYSKYYPILKSQSSKKYYFEEYSNDLKVRTPDYRTQLYWNPNVDITKKEIVFYTSDITGEFEIEIEGFTAKGIPVSIKDYFTVSE